MLIEKEIDGTISNTEKSELDRLQTEILAYRREVAPLSINELRAIHQKLRGKE